MLKLSQNFDYPILKGVLYYMVLQVVASLCEVASQTVDAYM